MIIIAHLLNATAVILGVILQTLIVLVIARVVLSWVNPDPYNPIVRFIVGSTDPLLALLNPIRRFISPKGSGFDFTPMVLMLILMFLQYSLVPILAEYALLLRQG